MMDLQEKILEELRCKKGESVSGAYLARCFGVSRNTVWKAVHALQQQGYKIGASTNRGYCLLPENDRISARGISERLCASASEAEIRVYDCVDSTNAVVRQLAEEGAKHGCTVIARKQTAGRGRMGRSFYSPPGGGLYMSVLLRPRFSAEQAQMITVAAAAAVACAAQAVCGEEAQIKWVNDVYCRGRKVCGILTEASVSCETGGIHYAVLGIGVNILPPQELPQELENVVGSLLTETSCAAEVTEALAAEILNRFFAYYETLEEKPFMEEYRRRSFIPGHEINVIRGGLIRPAYAVEIDEEARLLVRYPDGQTEALACGEVSVRLQEKNSAENA